VKTSQVWSTESCEKSLNVFSCYSMAAIPAYSADKD